MLFLATKEPRRLNSGGGGETQTKYIVTTHDDNKVEDANNNT